MFCYSVQETGEKTSGKNFQSQVCLSPRNLHEPLSYVPYGLVTAQRHPMAGLCHDLVLASGICQSWL